MSRNPGLERRQFLRGLGTAIALPALESLLPTGSAYAAAGPTPSPTRLAVLYVPNGIHMPAWKPVAEGADFQLPRILEPLQPFQREITLLSGLTHDKARANGDGAGDHARSAATFLTGTQAVKTNGNDIRAGVSVDQIAAQLIGRATQFPSLELGCEPGKLAGSCDSGYSCAYSNTLAWKSPTQPLPKETNPALVFDRLFSAGSAIDQRQSRYRRQTGRQSVLDFVAADARQLQPQLSGADRHKLQEYVEGIREIEQRLERASSLQSPDGQLARPEGPPDDYGERIRLMADLMILAFRTDATRVCTLMIANEGSNRAYRELGISDGHHALSHHEGRAEKLEKITQINRFHVEQLAYILGRLAAADEQGQSLLDNTMLVYGSGIGDGNRHNHDDLPVLVAGRGGGLLAPGRHIAYPSQTPLMNLFLTMLQGLGAPLDRVGDSTGPLPGLASA
ncbi:MAG: DUF1552 domain-containing protein [Planctomycetales bacterium]|nr:DUF1552 domain-containing protein [Planctomycetales bacterium]